MRHETLKPNFSIYHSKFPNTPIQMVYTSTFPSGEINVVVNTNESTLLSKLDWNLITGSVPYAEREKLKHQKSNIKFDLKEMFESNAAKRNLYTTKDQTPFDWGENIVVKTDIKNSNDLVTTLLVANVLKEYLNKLHRPNSKLFLYVPYFPYSRQDRACHFGEAFSLKVVIDMFKSAGYDNVYTDDMHSKAHIKAAKGNYVKSIVPREFYFDAIAKISDFYGKQFDVDNVYWCLPDQGAAKKFLTTQKYLGGAKDEIVEIEKIIVNKKRVDENIVMELLEAPEKVLITRPILVVDDICDGGATFIELGKLLKEHYPNNTLFLVVTHGFFTKGLSELAKYYDGILCKNNYSKE